MPSDYELTYNQFMALMRLEHARDLQLSRRLLAAEYKKLVTQLVRRIKRSAGAVEKARAALMIRDVHKILADYGINTERIITAGVRKTMTNALRGHSQAIAALESQSGRAVGHSFARVPREAFEGLLRKRQFAIDSGYEGFSSMFRSLQGKHLRGTAAAVDKAITTAVGTGKSSTELAKDISALLAPPEGTQLVQAAGSISNKAITETATLLGTKPSVVRSVQATIRRSELIAIHEMNTAFHEADAMATRRSPVIGSVRWQLSGAHPAVDVCDVLATSNAYNRGAGIYPINAIPSLPHPRCLCDTEKVLLEPRDWGNPKAQLLVGGGVSPTRLNESIVGGLMQKAATEGRTFTPKAVASALEQYTRVVEAAASQSMVSLPV